MNADFPQSGKICMDLNAVFLRRRKVRVHSSIQTTVNQGAAAVRALELEAGDSEAGGIGIVLPTCHVMVSMALTDQRRLRKGWNTPYAPYSEWNAFPARLKEGRKSVPALF